MKGFMDFLKKQGVVGLAVGFILGGAIGKLVTAVITDFVAPLIGLVMGTATGLATASAQVGTAKLMWGDFISVLIDFIVIAAVVYFGVKALRLDKLDETGPTDSQRIADALEAMRDELKAKAA